MKSEYAIQGETLPIYERLRQVNPRRICIM